MNILPLHAAPQFTQQVIYWIWNAFGEGMPRAFFQSIVEHSLTPGELPLTLLPLRMTSCWAPLGCGVAI